MRECLQMTPLKIWVSASVPQIWQGTKVHADTSASENKKDWKWMVFHLQVTPAIIFVRSDGGVQKRMPAVTTRNFAYPVGPQNLTIYGMDEFGKEIRLTPVYQVPFPQKQLLKLLPFENVRPSQCTWM